jgi:hypothetical protein
MKKTTLISIIVLGLLLILVVKTFSVSSTRLKSVITIYSLPQPETIDPAKIANTTDSLITFDKPYNLVFHGLENTLAGINDADLTIDVFVDNKSSIKRLGIWPFYKRISIKSEFSYRWRNPLKNEGEEETGLFNLEGKFKLTGYGSKKQIEKDALSAVDESIREKIAEEIQKTLVPTLMN